MVEMIINFTDPDGNDMCIADCVKFYTNKGSVFVERKGGGLLKFDFGDRVKAGICYQNILKSAKEWAKILQSKYN